ncbi:MAG: hypothetical protein BVN35_03920 [Proteobacteria bacterium ST_bin11]|nr:MAG: hypothetical protein BVN35_03920 [Proteobacteria bacterium ST_bin11]
MKTLLSLKIWLAVCLFAASTASSAGIIWESTDGNSNFISIGSGALPFPSGEMFGIFSANANLSSDAPVDTFTGVGSLTSASPFKLGLWTTSGWVGETGNSGLSSPNTFLLSFVKPNLITNNLSFLFGFDLKPAANQNPITAVPLPASVWFITSALLGFLYIGRSKQIV